MNGLDPPAVAILETVGAAGCIIVLGSSHPRATMGDAMEPRHVFTATHESTGERFVVRGENGYLTACALAKMVGIDLADG